MMDGKQKNQATAIQISLDVGHSSIGWAVFSLMGNSTEDIDLKGCGAVIFRADDCLASSRRGYRRQRRHIRSTRQRIERLKRLVKHVGGMSREELDKPGCAWPWLLAARVLNSKSGTNENLLLSWQELWDVLRWYAHNRGYDGNRRWSGVEPEDEENDTEKVENANNLLKHYGTRSMAETVCAVSGIDPLGKKKSANVKPGDRFKAKNAAFPREIVEGEVRRLLERHVGKLKGVTPEFVKTVMEDWRTIPCPEIKLPKRYQGGLLFGQLVPRFDNRIISTCPISGEKVPSKHCREFYDFRWGMQLANVRVGKRKEELRSLSVEERQKIDAAIRREGSFTEKEFKDEVRKVTECERDNLDTMLMHPDAKKALVVDPVQVELTKGNRKSLFPRLSQRVQKIGRGKLWKRKVISLGMLKDEMEKRGEDTSEFDAALAALVEARNIKRKKTDQPLTRETVLIEPIKITFSPGRAAYSRTLLKQAFADVLAGKHPKSDGCLVVTDDIRKAQTHKRIEEQTNNHLIRHRLLILERLIKDIVKEYAGGDNSQVRQVVIEVNRDLREFSGKTAKEIKKDLGVRLSNHSNVVSKLEKDLGAHGKITAGLIRKARIAADLGVEQLFFCKIVFRCG